MLGRSVAAAYSADWPQPLAPLADSLQAADLALANLESPLSDAFTLTAARQNGRSGSYNLCAPAGARQALQAAGLDLLALANNHAADCAATALNPAGPYSAEQRSAALAETSALLAQSGLQAVTPGGQPLRRTVNGQKLAFFALDDIGGGGAEDDEVLEAVRRAARQGDFVVVSVHWGIEYSTMPHARQVKLAQALADAGARLVWGHHPHAVQPLAWVWGHGQPSPTLVAYSLGNALFDQVVPPVVRRGALLQVSLADGEIQTTNLQVFDVNWKPERR